MADLKPGQFFELTPDQLKEVMAANLPQDYTQKWRDYETECCVVYDNVKTNGKLETSREMGYSLEEIDSMTHHCKHIRDVDIMLSAWSKISSYTRESIIEDICEAATTYGARFEDFKTDSRDFDLNHLLRDDKEVVIKGKRGPWVNPIEDVRVKALIEFWRAKDFTFDIGNLPKNMKLAEASELVIFVAHHLPKIAPLPEVINKSKEWEEQRYLRRAHRLLRRLREQGLI